VLRLPPGKHPIHHTRLSRTKTPPPFTVLLQLRSKYVCTFTPTTTQLFLTPVFIVALHIVTQRKVRIIIYTYHELFRHLTFTVFPTRFRATAHGVSAAAGKAGAIVSALAFNTLSKDIGTPACLWSASSPMPYLSSLADVSLLSTVFFGCCIAGAGTCISLKALLTTLTIGYIQDSPSCSQKLGTATQT
jgi:hypothetical protein